MEVVLLRDKFGFETNRLVQRRAGQDGTGKIFYFILSDHQIPHTKEEERTTTGQPPEPT